MNPQDSFNIPGLEAKQIKIAEAQKQQEIADNKAVADAVQKTLQSQPVLDSEQEELVNMSKGSAATAGVSSNVGSNGGGASTQTSQTQTSVQSQVQAATTVAGSQAGTATQSDPQTPTQSDPQTATQSDPATQVKAEEFTYTKEAQDKIAELEKAIKASNVPQTVLLVMSLALDLKTSDIHMEPEEDRVRIRYRIDGMLRQITEYKNNMHPAVVSRVKIMSDLKIDETRIPQDGRTSVQTQDGREMDLRVSTLPTVNGEKIVMRLQDKSKAIPTLEALGILGNAQKAITRSLTKPNGVILTSGPTGSGKTTTLYASLNILNKEGVNILTIEDPVEIQLDGLNQAQVKADIGFDFAKGLRAALRQDPDIIMVGEIRDHETIDVAIEAALTGHLVFSTIHTNSAVETITRIANMGIPQYLIASAVDTIIAQRLVRRVNPEKCERYQLEGKTLETVKAAIAQIPDSEKANYPDLDFDNPTFLKPLPQFAQTAYKGRVGVYEVLTMTGQLKDAILKGANVLELQKVAQSEGMVTLEQYGLILAMKGLTTLDEVYRVSNAE